MEGIAREVKISRHFSSHRKQLDKKGDNNNNNNKIVIRIMKETLRVKTLKKKRNAMM
jgi:hypothetical protein